MTPTEKHRAEAERIAERIDAAYRDHPHDLHFASVRTTIATALANAEREGMKRAAEIARNSGPATQDITSTMICDALDHAADLILAEAGEGE